MRAAERVETVRLILRRPGFEDVEAIFSRYASDAEVTRFMSWPRHESVRDTRDFIEFSEAEWASGPAGPYLVQSRADGVLLGGTGLSCETWHRAETGYVFARDAWGNGYATEALRAVVGVARRIGLIRLQAMCHPEHPASHRVLEKCGFVREGVLRRHSEFPNLAPRRPCDVISFGLILESAPGDSGRDGQSERSAT